MTHINPTNELAAELDLVVPSGEHLSGGSNNAGAPDGRRESRELGR